jgi:DNA (cytosine-5)-methyltransferase 1
VNVLDLFAGPGGWDIALAELGHKALGIELQPEVCATRLAAGHLTEQGDVAALEPWQRAPVWGLVGSPPCTAYSDAGKREGIADQLLVYQCARRLAEGDDCRAEVQAKCSGKTSLLVVEPLRWALALQPEWVALEQVPAVLGLWQLLAGLLEAHGYRTWVGMLNAADYGVPQVRRRAFLLAHKHRAVHAPEPTHAKAEGDTLFAAARLPWVSMAEALGWGMNARPYFTIASSRTSGGPDIEKVGGSNARRALYEERDSGRWEDPPTHMNTGRDWKKGGDRDDAQEVPTDQPAPTVSAKLPGQARWVMRQNARSKSTTKPVTEPAPTITGGHDHGDRVWVYERPSTTVQGDPRIWAPGHKENSSDPPGKYQQRRGDQAIRVELDEAAVLQGFPRDYPWQGNKSQRFQQVGNAVPPPLAKAVLGVLL